MAQSKTDYNLGIRGVCGIHMDNIMDTYIIEHVKANSGDSVHIPPNWAVSQKRIIIEETAKN